MIPRPRLVEALLSFENAVALLARYPSLGGLLVIGAACVATTFAVAEDQPVSIESLNDALQIMDSETPSEPEYDAETEQDAATDYEHEGESDYDPEFDPDVEQEEDLEYAPDSDAEYESDPVAPAAEEFAELQAEVAELRDEVRRMKDLLDSVMDDSVVRLRDENEWLRAEVERLRGQAGESTAGPVQVPGSPAEKASRLLSQWRERDAVAVATPVGGPDFTVVKEWGRTAEEAARLGAQGSSLKGIICAVPPGSTEEELTALGRRLRAEYADYNNINIKVFDDIDAARAYAERNEMDSRHHVLSVSRHPDTRMDTILGFWGGTVTEITLNE